MSGGAGINFETNGKLQLDFVIKLSKDGVLTDGSYCKVQYPESFLALGYQDGMSEVSTSLLKTEISFNQKAVKNWVEDVVSWVKKDFDLTKDDFFDEIRFCADVQLEGSAFRGYLRGKLEEDSVILNEVTDAFISNVEISLGKEDFIDEYPFTNVIEDMLWPVKGKDAEIQIKLLGGPDFGNFYEDVFSGTGDDEDAASNYSVKSIGPKKAEIIKII